MGVQAALQDRDHETRRQHEAKAHESLMRPRKSGLELNGTEQAPKTSSSAGDDGSHEAADLNRRPRLRPREQRVGNRSVLGARTTGRDCRSENSTGPRGTLRDGANQVWGQCLASATARLASGHRARARGLIVHGVPPRNRDGFARELKVSDPTLLAASIGRVAELASLHESRMQLQKSTRKSHGIDRMVEHRLQVEDLGKDLVSQVLGDEASISVGTLCKPGAWSR